MPLAPYVPLALAARSDRLNRSISDVLATGRDRRLPITLASETGRLVVALAAALLLLVRAANLVVRKEFCPRATFGGYTLYGRCASLG